MLRLSIITINLNNKTGLERTVKSIISQTYKGLELIVIDGGSTDGSIRIIEQFREYFSYSVSEKDKGIYDAMNKGIMKATGDYCFFLNSGDYFVNENVLTNVFNINFTEDIVQGNMLVCLNQKVIGKCCGKDSLTFTDIYASIIKHQASFIKRDLFGRFGLYNENLRIVADWEFFLKTVGIGGSSYRYIDTDISYFDNDGLSNNGGSITGNERQSVLNIHVPLLMQPDFELLLKYREFEPVFENKNSFFIIRVLKKIIKTYRNLSGR